MGGGSDPGIDAKFHADPPGNSMNDVAARSVPKGPISRERALHALYEAAELEHNLMCTYLYAAFSLRDGEAEGLAPEEAAAVSRWYFCNSVSRVSM